MFFVFRSGESFRSCAGFCTIRIDMYGDYDPSRVSGVTPVERRGPTPPFYPTILVVGVHRNCDKSTESHAISITWSKDHGYLGFPQGFMDFANGIVWHYLTFYGQSVSRMVGVWPHRSPEWLQRLQSGRRHHTYRYRWCRSRCSS